MAVTPGREVWLQVGGPEYATVVRPHFHQNWGAADVGKSDSWVLKVNPDGTKFYIQGHKNTLLAPGDAWALNPLRGDKFETVTGNYAGARLQPSDFTVAPNMKWQNMYRPPTGMPGMGGGGFTAVNPGMKRRVPAGQAWDSVNNMLGADQAAYPPPVDVDWPAALNVDRVAVSNATFEQNQGFGFTFGMGADFWGNAMLLRVYFGGSTPVEPLDGYGGEFCLVLFSSGQAVLYEMDHRGIPPVAGWVRRMTFWWAEPNSINGNYHTIWVWPMARDRIVFQMRLSTLATGTDFRNPLTISLPRVSSPVSYLYRDSPGQAGHYHQQSATGAGKIRLDLLRSYRMPIMFFLLKFPSTGWINDQPFTIPHALDAGTPIELYVDGFELGDITGIASQMFNATTNVALPQDASLRFLAHQGQSTYYAKFNFQSSSNHNQTPILFGYEVRVPVEIAIRTPAMVTGKVRDGSVTGPDKEPGHGSARVSIRDRQGTFDILRKHDRRYCRLIVKVPTTGPSGDPRGYVVIHEGETWQSKAQLRGREGLGNKPWYDYSLNMIDMWYRLQRQVALQAYNYRQDRNAPDPGSPNTYLPWAILAAIRDLIHRAGFPYDEIDAPGWDSPTALRLWWSPNMTQDDWLLWPGADLAKLIHRMAYDFLGKIVLRDPNAFNATNTNRGMWRVITPPTATEPTDPTEPATYDLANSKAAFYVRRPAVYSSLPPHVVEDEGGLPNQPGGAPSSFIKDETYFVSPQAPEGTWLVVTGTGDLLPSGAANQNLSNWVWNTKAVDWSAAHPTADPNSISYMDRWEPVIINDRTLNNPDAVAAVASRVARQALNGRLWCEFTAPLLFVKDPTDPLMGSGATARRRPLRVYDQVTLIDENGVFHPVMLRSVNPFWTSSRIMWAYHQGLFLDAR